MAADPAGALNALGDQLVPTTGQHGADIAAQRLDDLDLAALRDALELVATRGGGTALDLGCGWGAQGLRLATLGLHTTLIDQLPVAQTVAGCPGLADRLPLRYRALDVRTLQHEQLPAPLDLVCCQRMLHYLQFEEAETLLGTLRAALRPGARIYLSVSGLHSELGQGYEAATAPRAARFGHLAPAMAAKHGIHAAVCLMEMEDLHWLAGRSGFMVQQCWTSPFGNLKAVLTSCCTDGDKSA